MSNYTEGRNRFIVQQHEMYGYSFERLARWHGLKPKTVERIVRKAKASKIPTTTMATTGDKSAAPPERND